MARKIALSKSGERMLAKAEQLILKDSLINQVISKIEEVFQTKRMQRAIMETRFYYILDKGKICDASKDYSSRNWDSWSEKKGCSQKQLEKQIEKEQKKQECLSKT